jgi:hypothetical protein
MKNKLKNITTKVLVIGSGAAGISAAISASRNGVQTLLVEYNGFLGGISSTLPWLGFHDREYRQVVKGLAHEIVQKLHRSGASTNYIFDPKCSSFVSIDSHSYKCLAIKIADEAGVKIMLHTHMVDTIRKGNEIKGVVVEHKSGRQHIYADLTIDCSGDGDVAYKGGVSWEKGRTEDGLVQAPTLVFRLGGINSTNFINIVKDEVYNYREWLKPYPLLMKKTISNIEQNHSFIIGGLAALIEKARGAGDFDLPQTRIVGVKSHRSDQLTVVTTRVLGLDPTKVDSVSNAYVKLYDQIPQLVKFFQKYVPGCDNSYLIEIAPMLGIRESRRIIGDYILNADDLINGKVFDDAVAMGGYHIDIHRPKGTWVESHNVRAYTIPLRSLIAKGVNGLLMAGKCISATHEAIASTRVIPICMAQGEAAGTAAAMSIKSNINVRQLNISKLQEQLNVQNVEFGQSIGEPNTEIIERIGQLPFDEPPTTGDNDELAKKDNSWVR